MAAPKYRGPALRPSGPGEPGPEEVRPAPIWAEVKELLAHRELLIQFSFNDLKHRYFGSSIGIFWMVVNPIVELVTYTFVFHVLMGVTFRPQGGLTHFALFLFCGMVAWFAVAEGLTRATTSVTEHAHLIKKVNFPASVLPAHVVLSAVFNQLVRTVILALGAILFGGGLSPHFLLVPVAMCFQALFVLGLAFLLATANVYFRDTSHWVNAVLLAWMFITPIFYPARYIPEQAAPLLVLNPLAHLVGIHRELFLNQRLPQLGSLVIFGTCAVLVFVLGALTFQRHAGRFPDLV